MNSNDQPHLLGQVGFEPDIGSNWSVAKQDRWIDRLQTPGQSRLNQWRIMSMRPIDNLPNYRHLGTKFACPKDFLPINPVLIFGVGRCSGSFLSEKAPKNRGIVQVQIKTRLPCSKLPLTPPKTPPYNRARAAPPSLTRSPQKPFLLYNPHVSPT